MNRYTLPAALLSLLWLPAAARAAEEPAATAADDDEQVVEVHGRVHAGWFYQHVTAGDEASDVEERNINHFIVRRSQLKLTWRPEQWLKAQIQIDPVAGWNDSMLQDAYVQLSPWRQLRLRVGQFKKPYSALELRSPSRLKVIERGPGNDFIVEDLGYGGRDLGFKLYGRLIKSVRLDYDIGLFNGQIPETRAERDKDLVARMQIRPIKMLSLGTSWTFKLFNPDDQGDPERAWAGGGDVKLRLFGVRLHVEALVGENYAGTASADPLSVDLLGILSYRRRIPVQWGFALEPIFKFEMLDPDTNVVDDELLVYTPGINLYFGEYFRLMVHGDFERGGRNTALTYGSGFLDNERLMVNLCFDI